MENHLRWRSQIQKLFKANGFDRYINNSTPKLAKQTIHDDGIIIHITIDQNLATTIFYNLSISTFDFFTKIWIIRR